MTTQLREASTDRVGAPTADAGDEPPLTFRHPDPSRGDGALMWRLAAESEGLETNSEYAYHLFAAFFADTCLVAERDGEAAGFILGFRPPRDPETLFVWQIGVDARQRGRGVARAMLTQLSGRCYDAGVRYVEASISPDNIPSQRTFHAYQEQQQTECQESPLFPADWFTGDHEPEMRYRIGPIDRVDPPRVRGEAFDTPSPVPGGPIGEWGILA